MTNVADTALSSQAQIFSSQALFERETSSLLSLKERMSVGSGEGLDPAGNKPEILARIDRAALDFEAVFLSQMLKPMFEDIETDGPFGGGHAEEVFRGILLEEMGKEFTKNGGIGLSDTIRRELIKMQGLHTGPSPAAAADQIRKPSQTQGHKGEQEADGT